MLFAQQLVSDATKRMLELIKHHQPEKVFVMIPKKGGAEEADFARQLVIALRKEKEAKDIEIDAVNHFGRKMTFD